MRERITKFIIAGLLFVLCVYLYYIAWPWIATLCLLLSGLFVFLGFRNEYNLLAFFFLKRNKLNTARKILDRVKKPERMVKSQEAFYYFLEGSVEAQKTGPAKAEKYFSKALQTGLNMKANRAMAHLNLAGSSIVKRRKRNALNHIREAKKLDNYGLMKEQIRMMEEQVKKI
jgi:hypothetical protein